MKKMDNMKCFAMGMVVMGTMTSLVVPAVAKSTQENITAIYKNIKVAVDGIPVNTDDAEPFICNGTTYLPVRAVGEAIGKKVTWDGNSNTVYLGEVPGDKKYLVDICPPYDGENYKICSNKDNKYFTMSGEKRTNGFTINGNFYNESGGFAVINLNGEYSEMSFDVGHIDNTGLSNAVLNVYIDGKLTDEIELKGDDIAKRINIPLNYALQVKLEIKSKLWRPYYGFADIEIR